VSAGQIHVGELQALSRFFSYPEQWPETQALERFGLQSHGRWKGGHEGNGLQNLQGEYVRLFINALPEVPCPPYGSFYLEGALMGESTVQVSNLYLSYGYQTDEMADHIAVELEFLALLATLSEIEAAPGDYDSLLDHLRSWTPEFFDCVQENDGIGFYRDVSRYARRVIL
jgi:TorA maturation chaperone TorD